ncbi:hypothetical protein HWV23_00800 [Natronomonas halophila]|uniref:twin-arginine translocation signal domain-containing protein n=1 Tax=Natronomonas halophila TaxID=2747817 RepID=UPI0015B6F830|nr:twin-arginine translocation signal domain-containing protein [Natronomonas halophila]QLD84303.1 hypothetical protein HWV23_00800 [Natronomonas halophila]
MKLSRRDALRAGGGLLAAAGLAGCIEQRVTRRETRLESSTNWALNPSVERSLDAEAFATYTDDMADRYGDSGVWGLEAEQPDDLETAYVQRMVVSRETPGQPGGTESSLDPDEVDPDAPLLIVDASVAVYAVGQNRYRYWLWAAADGGDDRLVRDVSLSTISTSISLRDGTLTDAATVSQSDDEGEVTLGSPPSGRFPLKETTSAIETNSERREGGFYDIEWSGSVDGVQSVNGVCEEERQGDHDFFWSVGGGYTLEERV